MKIIFLSRSYGLKSITNNEELDEKLFNIYFKNFIHSNNLFSDKLTKNNKHEYSIELLDIKLMDLLNYWLPIGSKDEYCLKLAITNDLLQCTILLLIAKERKELAFQILYKSITEEKNEEKIC